MSSNERIFNTSCVLSSLVFHNLMVLIIPHLGDDHPRRRILLGIHLSRYVHLYDFYNGFFVMSLCDESCLGLRILRELVWSPMIAQRITWGTSSLI
jgi:hypothetical protein